MAQRTKTSALQTANKTQQKQQLLNAAKYVKNKTKTETTFVKRINGSTGTTIRARKL